MSYQKTYRIIKPEKWYIVDTFRPDRKGKPRMLKKEFDNPKQIQHNLDMYFKGNLRFDMIQGKEAIELELYVMNAYPNLQIYLRKYQYANYMITEQDKKSYRTKFRRQNRFGITNDSRKCCKVKLELHKKWG